MHCSALPPALAGAWVAISELALGQSAGGVGKALLFLLAGVELHHTSSVISAPPPAT